MSADKRPVSTDALETLGLPIGTEAKRDAIHIAVEPVTASQALLPGEHVGRLHDGTYGPTEAPLGIVDPFRVGTIPKGGRFWLLVYPRRITSLRHVWDHPDFPAAGMPSDEEIAGTVTTRLTRSLAAKKAEDYLREIAASMPSLDSTGQPPTYDELMAAAANRRNDPNFYWSDGRAFEGYPGLPDDFWEAYADITGHVSSHDPGTDWFSCSC